MSNPFQREGAQTRPSKSSALGPTNRFCAGLWTTRAPLRDGPVPRLQEKFYGANYDSLWDGLNTEISAKLTLIRRPGLSIYNPQNFNPFNGFYEFNVFSTNSQQIKILGDTTGDNIVHECTGLAGTVNTVNSGGTGIVTWVSGDQFRSALAGLYIIINGIVYTISSVTDSQHLVVSSNTGTQTGVSYISGVNTTVFTKPTTTSTVTTSGTGVTQTGGSLFNLNWASGTTITIGANNYTLDHVTDTTHLVLTTMVISPGSGQMMATLGGAGQTTYQQVGNILFMGDGANQTMWNGQSGTAQSWGLTAPTDAPTVVNTPVSNPYPSWAANTFYLPVPYIRTTGSSTGSPIFEKLTTAGTTGVTEPVWDTVAGHTNADGSAVWTTTTPNDLHWQSSHSYTLTTVVTGSYTDPVSGSTIFALFEATTAGVSGGTTPAWGPGNVVDGAVTWQNQGAYLTWLQLTGVTGTPTATTISLAGTITDSNNNTESPATPGLSGSTAPVWAQTTGGSTADTGVSSPTSGTYAWPTSLAGLPLTWTNGGPLNLSPANTGTYTYAYAFEDSGANFYPYHVSTASPRSDTITKAANAYITVQGVGTGQALADMIQIYRTVQGGSSLLLLAEIVNPGAGVQWTYNDTTPDTGLNNLVQAEENDFNDPPPFGLTNLSFHLDRVWGSVGNVVYYSDGPNTYNGDGHQAFPPLNNFVFPSAVKRLWPQVSGMIVFTSSGTYLIQGSGTTTLVVNGVIQVSGSPLYALPWIGGSGTGILGYNSFAQNGAAAFILTPDKTLLYFDPAAGVADNGFPIAAEVQTVANINPGVTYLTWHTNGSLDRALYLNAPTTTVGVQLLESKQYRMNQTSAPETGLSWSPLAFVNVHGFDQTTYGTSAVASIESAPGLRKLIYGHAKLGGIMYRNTAVYTDTAIVSGVLTLDNTYDAFATIGSLVLAQPGQLAEIEFIETDCPASGTSPTITMWLDEISTFSGSSNGITFSVTANCDDPPELNGYTAGQGPSGNGWASQTLLQKRSYLDQAGQPVICRHCQIKFDWPAANSPDELYSYTLYGSVRA